MLGIDVSITTDKVRFPIMFDGVNKCVACGSEDSLIFVDMFDNQVREEVHRYNYMKCTKCQQKYSIKWVKNNDGLGYHPCAVDPSFGRQFQNFVADKIINFMDN